MTLIGYLKDHLLLQKVGRLSQATLFDRVQARVFVRTILRSYDCVHGFINESCSDPIFGNPDLLYRTGPIGSAGDDRARNKASRVYGFDRSLRAVREEQT